MTRQPHVVVVLVDDMGYSDIGCYGGEIPTGRSGVSRILNRP